MADDPQANAGKSDEVGEGSYAGTRDYNERTRKFLDDKGDEVEALAEDAAEALDGDEGDEGDELRRAEAEGKAHAKR